MCGVQTQPRLLYRTKTDSYFSSTKLPSLDAISIYRFGIIEMWQLYRGDAMHMIYVRLREEKNNSLKKVAFRMTQI